MLTLIKGHKTRSYVIKSHNVALVNQCANSCLSHTDAGIKKTGADLSTVAVVTGTINRDRNRFTHTHTLNHRSLCIFVHVCLSLKK